MNQSVHNAMEDLPQIRVMDEWHDSIPEDLYIPPAAFEILLEHFEGPLDFLIYLIQKNGFDLLQLDIAPIAAQYLSYMDAMKSLNIELTADYMVIQIYFSGQAQLPRDAKHFIDCICLCTRAGKTLQSDEFQREMLD